MQLQFHSACMGYDAWIYGIYYPYTSLHNCMNNEWYKLTEALVSPTLAIGSIPHRMTS